MSPADAERLGIAAGEEAAISSRRGAIIVTANFHRWADQALAEEPSEPLDLSRL